MATKVREKSASEQHVESLKGKYDKLAGDVVKTAPNTPERHAAMEAKKAAFLEYHTASEALQKADVAAQTAEQKQSAAEAAAKDAAQAKKAAADVAKHPERAVSQSQSAPAK